MRREWLLSALLAALLAGGETAGAQAADDATLAGLSAASPEYLVGQLGSGKYRERVRATRELERRGLAAREALQMGVESPDAEIRHRCRKLLEVVLARDFQTRLRAFAADRAGTGSHDMPGWERFRQLASPTPESRELFVSMLSAEQELIASLDGGSAPAAGLLEARCNEIDQDQHKNVFGQSTGVPLGTLAALFFVASDPSVAVSDRTAALLGNLSYQQSFQTALVGGPHVATLRKMLGQWVERGEGGPGSFQNLLLAMKHGLSEGLKPAEGMIRRGAQPQIIVYAILAVGRFGDRTHLALLAPLLEDESVAMTFQTDDKQFQTQVRDVALAVLVHLTEQKYADYGFTRIEQQPDYLFNPGTIGFAEEAQRTAALEKWQAWMAEQEPAEAAE